jgi:hypothetical protein
MIIGVYGP